MGILNQLSRCDCAVVCISHRPRGHSRYGDNIADMFQLMQNGFSVDTFYVSFMSKLYAKA